jgi:hypothetical protein
MRQLTRYGRRSAAPKLPPRKVGDHRGWNALLDRLLKRLRGTLDLRLGRVPIREVIGDKASLLLQARGCLPRFTVACAPAPSGCLLTLTGSRVVWSGRTAALVANSGCTHTSFQDAASIASRLAKGSASTNCLSPPPRVVRSRLPGEADWTSAVGWSSYCVPPAVGWAPKRRQPVPDRLRDDDTVDGGDQRYGELVLETRPEHAEIARQSLAKSAKASNRRDARHTGPMGLAREIQCFVGHQPSPSPRFITRSRPFHT